MNEYGDYFGDEDEIESVKREKEENDPRHEPNFEIEELLDKYFSKYIFLDDKEDK